MRKVQLTYLVSALFFLSGFTSLVYQVVWMRHLSLFFGSDVYSATITLSSFMGGLALGGFVVARFADRLENPLIWYGLLEAVIGAYAFFFPGILHAFAGAYQNVYRDFFEMAPWRYHLFRMAVAVATLLVPTAMMGATLPLIVRRFVDREAELGRFSGYFYAVNTLGALVGVLVAGFLFLPLFGVTTTTNSTVIVNLAIGAVSLLVGLRSSAGRVSGAPAVAKPRKDGPSRAGYDPRLATACLVVICLSGMAGLALEVVWTRLLIQSFSATVYSFSIMLSCFLFGIFYGSQKVAKVIDAHPNPSRFFGLLEIGIGVSVAALGFLTYVAPTFFGLLLWGITALSRGAFAPASVLATFLVSVLLLAAPTILLGATFPAAVKVCTPNHQRTGHGTGRVYAANTSGAIVGPLLGGFFLIPTFGSRASLVILAAIFIGNGLFLVYESGDTQGFALKSGKVPLSLAFTGLAAAGVLLLPRLTVMNFNMQRSARPEVVYHGEGVAHTVDIVRNEKRQTIMMVDGNIEADTSYTQRRHFILKGHLPLILHPEPREVLVIGLGLGITLAATERYPTVASIQVVELSPEMLVAHRYLGDITGGVLRSPKVSVRIDDGRNFLSVSERKFDVITADPIHPRTSGVGYLYTKEYYAAVKRMLRPGGVVCQWMPMYSISKQSFDVAFRTFASVFPNASFWYVRGHGLFVATEGPFAIDFAMVQERLRNPNVRQDLASIGIKSAEELLGYLMMGPQQIHNYLAAIPDKTVNTDDNAYLEYHTPFEFLGTTESILRGLLPFAGLDEQILRRISPAEKEKVSLFRRERESRILPELREDLP